MFVNKIKTLPTFKNNIESNVKCDCERIKEKEPKKDTDKKLDIIA